MPPVQAWASKILWPVMASTRPRSTASVIVIFSRESVSKMPPIGFCSVRTISIGVAKVTDTLEVCLPESGESSLIDVRCSVMVVVLVVVIFDEVGDSGDRTVENDVSEGVVETEDNVDVREDVLGSPLVFNVFVVDVT